MSSFQYLTSVTIPPGKNRFSSDHPSQVWLGENSTWMGDRLGILRVVDFPFFIPRKICLEKIEKKRFVGKKLAASNILRLRTYHQEKTGSRLITEVKSGWAKSVLGWVSTWEYFVLYTLPFLFRLKSVWKKRKIKDLWVKNEQLPISYVYDHTTRKKPVLV